MCQVLPGDLPTGKGVDPEAPASKWAAPVCNQADRCARGIAGARAGRRTPSVHPRSDPSEAQLKFVGSISYMSSSSGRVSPRQAPLGLEEMRRERFAGFLSPPKKPEPQVPPETLYIPRPLARLTGARRPCGTTPRHGTGAGLVSKGAVVSHLLPFARPTGVPKIGRGRALRKQLGNQVLEDQGGDGGAPSRVSCGAVDHYNVSVPISSRRTTRRGR